jgi:serpin B
MTRVGLLGFVLIVAAGNESSAQSEQQGSSGRELENLREIVAANTAFALDLYRGLQKSEGNVFFSPWSISTALGMTYWGARGDTAAQMAEVLHLPKKDEQLPAAIQGLQDRLDKQGAAGQGYELAVANALWGHNGFLFSQSYLEFQKKYYGAGLRLVNFRGATEASRKRINQWVAEKTRSRIPELLKRGIVGPQTRLVLTNAIYFKGDWVNEFDESKTKRQPFYLANGRKVEVPLMYRNGSHFYARTKNVQLVEIPYKGKELSMVILLPAKEYGLSALEESLTFERFESLIGLRRHPFTVQVYLPRFQMTFGAGLKQVLGSLGMRDAFDARKADFSGMTANRSRSLVLQDAVHSAFVAVDEKGTEAAAATGAVMRGVALRQPTIFRADRPFLFVIQDRTTRSILFFGRLSHPK